MNPSFKEKNTKKKSEQFRKSQQKDQEGNDESKCNLMNQQQNHSNSNLTSKQRKNSNHKTKKTINNILLKANIKQKTTIIKQTASKKQQS